MPRSFLYGPSGAVQGPPPTGFNANCRVNGGVPSQFVRADPRVGPCPRPPGIPPQFVRPDPRVGPRPRPTGSRHYSPGNMWGFPAQFVRPDPRVGPCSRPGPDLHHLNTIGNNFPNQGICHIEITTFKRPWFNPVIYLSP